MHAPTSDTGSCCCGMCHWSHVAPTNACIGYSTTCEPQQTSALCAYLQDESAVSAAEALMQSWCVTDPHLPGHPVVYVSPGFEATTGFSSQDIVGKSCRLLQGPKTEPGRVQQVVQCVLMCELLARQSCMLGLYASNVKLVCSSGLFMQ